MKKKIDKAPCAQCKMKLYARVKNRKGGRSCQNQVSTFKIHYTKRGLKVNMTSGLS